MEIIIGIVILILFFWLILSIPNQYKERKGEVRDRTNQQIEQDEKYEIESYADFSISEIDVSKDNLTQGFELFIKAMRIFISSEMSKVFGKNWEIDYFNTLTEKQKISWTKNKNEGKRNINLIDFSNLSGFALNQKELLRGFAGKYTNILPAKFSEINEMKNRHHQIQDLNEYKKSDKVFFHMQYFDETFFLMIDITKMFGMKKITDDIRELYGRSPWVDHTNRTDDHFIRRPSYIWEYEKLTFSKKKIDSLLPDEKFTIRVKKTKESFTMTKREFYRVFDNVVNSKTYLEKGYYSYTTIPRKAYIFYPLDDDMIST